MEGWNSIDSSQGYLSAPGTHAHQTYYRSQILTSSLKKGKQSQFRGQLKGAVIATVGATVAAALVSNKETLASQPKALPWLLPSEELSEIDLNPDLLTVSQSIFDSHLV